MVEPKQITVRGVPPELARRLRAVSRERGESLNATVIYLLEKATGIDERKKRLQRYATWTAADLEEFERVQRAQRTIDERLWR